MEAIANAGDIDYWRSKSRNRDAKTPTGVVMQDLDLTDINAMKSLLLFAAQ
jgi:hypothetical protein